MGCYSQNRKQLKSKDSKRTIFKRLVFNLEILRSCNQNFLRYGYRKKLDLPKLFYLTPLVKTRLVTIIYE